MLEKSLEGNRFRLQKSHGMNISATPLFFQNIFRPATTTTRNEDTAAITRPPYNPQSRQA